MLYYVVQYSNRYYLLLLLFIGSTVSCVCEGQHSQYSLKPRGGINDCCSLCLVAFAKVNSQSSYKPIDNNSACPQRQVLIVFVGRASCVALATDKQPATKQHNMHTPTTQSKRHKLQRMCSSAAKDNRFSLAATMKHNYNTT